MLYNQEQRQMMIWEQRETRKAIKGGLLLMDLGFRLMRRRFNKRFARPESIVLAG